MEVTGTVQNTSFDMEGNILVTLKVNEKKQFLEGMNSLKDCLLNIKLAKYRKKKSDAARKYFWTLIEKLSPCYKADNWTTYLMQLRRWGVTYQVKVLTEAVDILRREYRYIEIEEEWQEYFDGDIKSFCSVILFPGISLYNTAEMSRLIEGTVEDCKEWGIETLSPQAIQEMELAWKGGSHGI